MNLLKHKLVESLNP